MERAFVLKLIHQVGKTYTHGSSLPLTRGEEDELISEIILKQNTHQTSDLLDITHDVVYRFFTGQSEEE